MMPSFYHRFSLCLLLFLCAGSFVPSESAKTPRWQQPSDCTVYYGKVQLIEGLPWGQRAVLRPYQSYQRWQLNRCLQAVHPHVSAALRQYSVPSPTPWLEE